MCVTCYSRLLTIFDLILARACGRTRASALSWRRY